MVSFKPHRLGAAAVLILAILAINQAQQACAIRPSKLARVSIPESTSESISMPLDSSPLFGLMNPAQLVNIDESTAKPLGHTFPPIQHELQGQGLSTMDTKNKVLYFMGYNSTSQATDLVGIDTTTGKIVHDVVLPYVSGAFVGVGQFIQYDPRDDSVLCVGHDPAVDKQLHLIRVFPATHKLESIAVIEHVDILDVLGGASAFDYDKGTFYLTVGVKQGAGAEILILGYNTTDGKQVVSVKNTANLGSMDYEPTLKGVVGLSFADGSREVTVLDGAGKFTTLGKVPDNYVMMSGSVSALDEARGILFGFLANSTVNGTASLPAPMSTPSVRVSPRGESYVVLPGTVMHPYDISGQQHRIEATTAPAPPQYKFDLLQLDIKTLKVVRAPLACTEDPLCPWSIDLIQNQ